MSVEDLLSKTNLLKTTLDVEKFVWNLMGKEEWGKVESNLYRMLSH